MGGNIKRARQREDSKKNKKIKKTDEKQGRKRIGGRNRETQNKITKTGGEEKGNWVEDNNSTSLISTILAGYCNQRRSAKACTSQIKRRVDARLSWRIRGGRVHAGL